MEPDAPRRGIERKILASILTVGIVPLTLALVLGYVAVRGWQGASAEQSLLNAARKTAAGLRIASASYFATVQRLANEPQVREALLSARAGEQGPSQGLEDLLQRTAIGEKDRIASIAVLDSRGDPVAVTGQWGSQEPFPLAVVEALGRPELIDVSYSPGNAKYLGHVVAPVILPNTDRPAGYVSEILDVEELLDFALGRPGAHEGGQGIHEVYEIVYASEGEMRVASLEFDDPEQRPSHRVRRADPRLVELLREEKGKQPGVMRLAGYGGDVRSVNVFLAHAPLFEGSESHVVVCRSESDVFRNIDLGALGALVLCSLVIAALCLHAYLNVHNNIVRNIMLVNEGAQIIGQGDLDLKLKIATGDEIEELATSFNKMALALKRNIGRLGESEEKYRSLITSIRDGIVQTDPRGIIGFINPAGAEILGLDHFEEALGKGFAELLPESEELSSLIGALRSEGFAEHSRVRVTSKDGRRICLEISGNLVYDDGGDVIGIEGIFRDVTGGVLLERESRERAERLGAINQIANVINSSLQAGRVYESLVVEVKKLVDFDFASLSLLSEKGEGFDVRHLWPEQADAPQASCSIDDEKWCAPTVARTEQCLVIERLGAEGTPPLKDFPPVVRSCLCAPLFATGRIIGTLNLGARAEGAFSKHDVEVLEQMAPHVAVAIRNAQLLESLQVSLEDVTRAQEKLHQANEELKTLDEMKTNLLSNVSHELRTPLVAVMGYTDMIYNGKVGPINDAQREYLEITLRNIEKLVTLIENLLDFSRLHRGAETLVFNTFDLVDCARTGMEIVRPVAESREITLDITADEDEVLVEGDKGKLGQVFNNLLSNAVKFNHHGGRVTVEIRTTEDTVESVVSDTGIGIPPEGLDKVFTRFYQYDGSSTRKFGGAGIGLSIAQDIVRLHGSRMTVTSEVGKGSTFRFSLPRKLTRQQDEERLEGDPGDEETHLLVSIVTRDRTLSAQVRTLLDAEGIDVVAAGTPARALSIVERHRPDVIMVDMEAGIVGEEVLDTLLEESNGHGVPVVMFTGEDGLYEKYRSRVASRLKPGFRKSSLLSGIHYALEHAAATGDLFGNRILCVDDDPEVNAFLSRCLEAEGYEVDQCDSGEAALDRVGSRDYGLVLLDIAMPGMDGWETCRRIKSNPKLSGVRVYMVTAKPIETSGARSKEAGSDGYLLKPFKPEDLVELVRSVESIRPGKET